MNNSILYSYIYEISFSYFDGSVSASPINCIAFKLKLSKKKIELLCCWGYGNKISFFFQFQNEQKWQFEWWVGVGARRDTDIDHLFK